MAYENLLYEVKDQIATDHFQSAEGSKRAEPANRGRTWRLPGRGRSDANVRVLILTGAGEKAFVAGADINELAQRTPVDGKDFSLFGQAIFHQSGNNGKTLHRGHQRLRAGRRLRTCLVLLNAHRQPQRV